MYVTGNSLYVDEMYCLQILSSIYVITLSCVLGSVVHFMGLLCVLVCAYIIECGISEARGSDFSEAGMYCTYVRTYCTYVCRSLSWQEFVATYKLTSTASGKVVSG